MFFKGIAPLFLLVICTLHSTPTTHGSRILAAYIFPGKSHFMMHNAVVRELLKRGHEVTYVTPFSLAHENLGNNYTEVLIPVYDFWKDIHDVFQVDNLFELSKLTSLEFLKLMQIVGLKSTDFAFQQPQLQQIINAEITTEKRYDILLAEQFFNEAVLALAYKFDIPYITTCTVGVINHISEMMGIITPWSFVPHTLTSFSTRMSFVERIKNIYVCLYDNISRKFYYLPEQDALIRKYFSHLPVKIPYISRIENDVSAILLNNYMPLEAPRPLGFNMIPVGGMHIDLPGKLPNAIQKFLDEADAGAIYFSLGTNVQSSDMPPEKLKMFLNIFSNLKQRVLWKYEDENLKNLPSNIMVQKWMPQSDILAHPNIKIFITHGGLFGTQEGVHYGVPMLGMPIYCDQHLNMFKAVQNGYAISLSYQSITEEKLRESLNDLLENPKYRTNMDRISSTFHDRPMSAKDTAMYWIEYVIRHKGAHHMRPTGLDLEWYQFYLLDVVATLVGGILVLSIVISYILSKCNKKSNEKLKSS